MSVLGSCLSRPTPSRKNDNDVFINNNVPINIINKRLQGIIQEEKAYQTSRSSNSANDAGLKSVSRASSASSLPELAGELQRIPNGAAQRGLDSEQCSVDSDIEIICEVKGSEQEGANKQTCENVSSTVTSEQSSVSGDLEANDESNVSNLVSSDKPQGSNLVPEFGKCTADSSTCLVHGENRQTVPWSFCASVDSYEQLMTSLNVRGFREGPLHEALQADKTRTVSSMMRCDTDSLQSAFIPTQKPGKPRYQQLL